MKKLLFIFNPRAGKARIKQKLFDVIDLFTKSGYEVTVHPTQSKGDGRRIAAEKSRDYDLVVCSGGDGTLDEIVSGMVECGYTESLGYIPSGSTNDFANSLGLPRDLLQAAQTAVSGKDYACDIGSFNGESFIYIAAFGLFTNISYETSQDIKNQLGHMAYLLEGVKTFTSIKAYLLRICYEDEEGREVILEEEFIFGMVTNSVSIGGFKWLMGKDVALDDGKFEVLLIKKPVNTMDLNSIVSALVNRNVNTEKLIYLKSSRICFCSQERIPWTLDGEFGGSHTEAEILNKREAVKIRIPVEESFSVDG